MAALRTFLRKYWIIIVILLWVIAWANRDRLAGVEPSSPAAAGDQAVVTAAAAPEAARPASAEVDYWANPETPATASRRDFQAEPQPAATVAPSQEPAEPREATGSGGGTEAAAEPELQRAEQSPSAAVAKGEAEAPAGAVQERPARILAQARIAARDRGPLGAAEVVAEGLRGLPADSPERAELLGEMGNFYFGGRDMPRALAAYDRALQALPSESRGRMIERLTPVYDRFHPMGRSHLEQFR